MASVSDTMLHLWNVDGVTLGVSESVAPHVWRVFRKISETWGNYGSKPNSYYGLSVSPKV